MPFYAGLNSSFNSSVIVEVLFCTNESASAPLVLYIEKDVALSRRIIPGQVDGAYDPMHATCCKATVKYGCNGAKITPRRALRKTEVFLGGNFVNTLQEITQKNTIKHEIYHSVWCLPQICWRVTIVLGTRHAACYNISMSEEA